MISRFRLLSNEGGAITETSLKGRSRRFVSTGPSNGSEL